ncbi:MAG: hypothetical protein NVSMB9_20390 [Isosphaeraceae bacterium]
MAQFYTLEEAARVLGMSPEELQARARHREVRAFLDDGSWRFRVADVDELARHRGLGGDAELQLSDLDSVAPAEEKDLDLSEFRTGRGPHGQPTGDFFRSEQKPGSGSDHDLLLDDLSLPPNPVTGSSSVIIGMGRGGKLPSDSDVLLASPRDFRMPGDSDVTLIARETSRREHPGSGTGSGDTSARPGPLGSSAEVPVSESGSDSELSPSSVSDALQPPSGSDFELGALDGSDEFESTPLRKPSDSDVTAADPGLSGINLSRPSDSGINLMGSGNLNLGGASSIELTPLSSSEIKPGPKASAKTAINPAPARSKPSLSDTPPPGVRKGEKDIFDDTDFEVDALASDTDDSEDKTMRLEAASDFEIEESDTGSEVFAIDEEDVDQNAATTIGSVAVDDEEEALVSGRSFEDDLPENPLMAQELLTHDEAKLHRDRIPVYDRDSPQRSPMVVANAEWGPVSMSLLGMATVMTMLLAFVTMDLALNFGMRDEGSVSFGLVKLFARAFGL